MAPISPDNHLSLLFVCICTCIGLMLSASSAQARPTRSPKAKQRWADSWSACSFEENAPSRSSDLGPPNSAFQALAASLSCGVLLSSRPRIPAPPPRAVSAMLMTRHQQQLRLWNKIMGITATALLFTTSIIGDKNVLDTFANRLPSQGLLSAHHGLIIASSVAYLAANILGWMDPLVFRTRAARFWYRVMRWIHTIGFFALIGLGIANARLTPGATTGKIILSVTHMSAGYITLGALATGTLLLFF